MSIPGTVVIITGSAQGLGKAFAVRLLAAGARVCISDVREEGGLVTLRELREKFGEKNVVFVQCDVTKEDQFIRLFEEAEKFFSVDCVDILVNNAGINTNWGWRKCMEVNIMGVMTGSEIAIERMKKTSKKGSIVNIGSMAGILTGFSEDSIGYFVSKHGVVTLSRTLAVDFKKHGVSVKCLCPTWADTELVSGVRKEHKETVDKLVKATGMMTVEHVAEGFFKLVTECGNGSVMAATKGVPFFLIPDTSMVMVMFLANMSKLVNKVGGVELVRSRHVQLGAVIMMALVLLLLAWIF